MKRHELTDEQWALVESHLPRSTARTGRPASDRRTQLNGIFWILATGAPWRDLPERFGPWGSVWKRFDRWGAKGVWKRVFEALQDPDLEWVIIDSTVIRAHQHAAGKKGGKEVRPSGVPGGDSARRSTSSSTPWATRSSSS